MTIRDRLYLRFGLFARRYGRMWCAFLEGLLVGTMLLVAILTLWGATQLVVWAYYTHVSEVVQEHVKQVEAEKVRYEQIIVACLNDGGYQLDGKMRPCSL